MILCSCGKEHASRDSLTVLGWQDCIGGEVALLANCDACASTIVAEYHVDAALCRRCRQAITNGARKVVDEETHRIYCEACAAREGIGVQPVAMAFKQWVKSGAEEALRYWRMTVRFSVWEGP